MKKNILGIIILYLFASLISGCGLSIYEDWQSSGGRAIVGGGAIAGKDYINGLLPSEEARKYFSRISVDGDTPIETVNRTDDVTSKTGVKYVKNGGILIPPGVTISYKNRGYCLDPHLPAPNAGHEFQLIPMTQLIPEDLQGTYKKLLTRAANGDTQVKTNMQHLMWALRTAGTDAPYANNLTPAQKKILDRCGDYQGQFEEFHTTAKSNAAAMKELLGLADSFLNIQIGGVTYKASDLLDPDVANKKINEHLNQLIQMGASMPVEKSGFNFGELQKGIYTDVRGIGPLAFEAKIANNTGKSFIYYPQDYIGQSGSGIKNQGFTFFATANSGQYQRVTGGTPDKIEVEDQREPEKKDDDDKCTCDLSDALNKMAERRDLYLDSYIKAEQNRRAAKIFYIANNVFVGIPDLVATEQEFNEWIGDVAFEKLLENTPPGLFLAVAKYATYMRPYENSVSFWYKKLQRITWKCPKCKTEYGPLGGYRIPGINILINKGA